jgi:hypothetical protein
LITADVSNDSTGNRPKWIYWWNFYYDKILQKITRTIDKKKSELHTMKKLSKFYKWLIKKQISELQSIILNPKLQWWMYALIMWKKTRDSKESMKIFKSSNPISIFKTFNHGIIYLQEEFQEALKNSLKWLLDDEIKQ